MGNGIVIRVLAGTVLSTAIKNALQERFPGYVLETFSEQPDYKKNYSTRLESLYSAFQFIQKAYPFSPENNSIQMATLEADIKESVVAARVSMEHADAMDVPQLQQALKKCTANIIDAVGACWGVSCDDAAELLNEAEQYDIMGKGRPDLATLSYIDGVGYTLQADESLPPYSDEVINELKQIKKDGYPNTPTWFASLSEPENHFIHTYFSYLGNDVKDVFAARADFNAFLDVWNSVSKSAQFPTDLAQITNRNPPFPRWFTKLPKHQQEMLKELTKTPDAINEKLAQFKKILGATGCQDDLNQIIKIPQWYWVLSKHQQCFLKEVLQSKQTVEEAVSFLCSRHRTLPMLANFAAHSLFKITIQEGVTKEEDVAKLVPMYSSPKFRSSHVATRNGFNWPIVVQRRHVLANLCKALEKAEPGQAIIFQTLVSPVGDGYLTDSLSDHLAKFFPDVKLEQIAREAVADRGQSPTLVKKNHPFNMYKYWDYTTTDDKDCLAILAAANALSNILPDLKPIIANYSAALDSPFGSATFKDKVGRELFLSSLEQLLILTMKGYSYGSCVSGKDRKAVELIHTDAMYLYKDKYNCWPLFSDTDENRANFVSIVAEVYATRHHHEHAGQNAPGAKGIKTPDKYFPNDISDAINKRLKNKHSLDFDDKQATNNEVRAISKGSKKTGVLSPTKEKLCNLIARQLGEEVCKELYTKLRNLLSQNHLFARRPSSNKGVQLFQKLTSQATVPYGIHQINQLIAADHTGNTNVKRMAGILVIACERPAANDSRTAATKLVYSGLRSLVETKKTVGIETCATEAVAKWGGLFEASKQDHLLYTVMEPSF